MDNFSLLKDLASESFNSAKGAVAGHAAAAVGRAKEMVGLVSEPTEPPPEPSILDDLNQSCALTLKQRIYGFAACLTLGILCTLMSMLVIFSPVKFGLAYTLGNLMALGSTGFLIGFGRQTKLMFDPVRVGAAAVYLVAIVLTLVAALYVRDPLLTLLCIVVQGCALVWYALSYVPFAQTAAKRCVRYCYESEF